MPLSRGAGFQISSFYTLFLWVPLHLEGALYVLLIMVLMRANTLAHRLAIAVLFAALLRCSTFVFIPAAVAFAVVELLSWPSVRSWPERLKAITLQVLIFSAFSLPFFLVLGGRSNILGTQFFRLHFFSSAEASSTVTLMTIVETALNVALTFPFILFIDLGIVFVLGIWFLFSPKSPDHEEPFPRKVLWVFFLAPLLVNTFYLSGYANELFMRGMIPAQLVLSIAFAYFMDRHPIKKFQYIPVFFILAIHVTNIFTEFHGRSTYTQAVPRPMFEYIRAFTPKSAVFFTDEPVRCAEISAYGNRLCMNNPAELMLDEVTQGPIPPSLRGIDFHQVDSAHLTLGDHPRYLLVKNPAQRPWLKFLRMDQGLNLYEVLP
jgi:hypothetical protein